MAQSLASSPETCRKCGGRGQVVTQHSTPFGTIRNSQVCPDCGGTGKTIKEKCPDCHGSGYISSRKKIQVSIPAGIDNGQSVRIRDKGEPGVNGGPRGDLLVEVVVDRHPIFQRQEMNIFSTVPVSFAVAALGGEILIDTVDGKVVYDVKAGTRQIHVSDYAVRAFLHLEIRMFAASYVTHCCSGS